MNDSLQKSDFISVALTLKADRFMPNRTCNRNGQAAGFGENQE